METRCGNIAAIPDVPRRELLLRLRCRDKARKMLRDYARSQSRNACDTQAVWQHRDVRRLGRGLFAGGPKISSNSRALGRTSSRRGLSNQT